MDRATYYYLRYHPHLLKFVRHNPMWYRYLSRDPAAIEQIEKASKKFYGKTFSQRIDRIHEQIQFVDMMFKFSNLMKD